MAIFKKCLLCENNCKFDGTFCPGADYPYALIAVDMVSDARRQKEFQ